MQQLFSDDGFMPHGHCYLWNPGLLRLHVTSDALIALSYYSIPLTLLYFLHRKKDVEFSWILMCFAVFIVTCGTTHLMEIWTIWHPAYWASGVIKVLTALTSVPTAFLLIRLMPKALALPSPDSLREANTRLQKEAEERTVVEAALRKSNLMFQRLFENTPESTVLINRTGEIIRANSKVRLLFRPAGDELVGKPLGTLLPDASRAAFAERLASCVAAGCMAGRDTAFELTAYGKEGKVFPVEILLSPLETDEGLGAIAVLRDLTDQKRGAAALAAGRQAELERDQFFELSGDLFSIVDFEGRYKRLNPAWEKTLGFPREELLGSHGAELIHPADTTKADRVRKQIRATSDPHSFELRFRCKDGSYRWILCNAVSDLDQKLIYFTGRDITRRKTNEGEIETLNSALRNRASELELLNAETEAFSYSVSHDLRAPLRHIGSFADLLGEHEGASFDATGRRYLGIISAAVKQMGQIIDDVLSFSRAGRTPLSLTRVDNNSLVAEIIGSGQYGNKGRAIEWEIGPLNPVQADAGLLRQVWANLIGNAVKYSSKNPRARISINGTIDSVTGVQIFSVKDNGVGFDMAHVGRLFAAFQRLHEAADFEGTGIGLANVHRIVARHGGRTWAEGKIGEGATFYYSLPLSLAAELPPAAGVSFDHSVPTGSPGLGQNELEAIRRTRSSVNFGALPAPLQGPLTNVLTPPRSAPVPFTFSPFNDR